MRKNRSEPREELISRMEEELREVESEIEVQETRLEDSDWDPKTDYEKPIDELKIELREIREKLGEVGSAGPSQWKKVYEEAEEDLARMGDRLKTLIADLDNLILE
jgi:DNA repair exonuclease SbcCD ATPase subunit